MIIRPLSVSHRPPRLSRAQFSPVRPSVSTPVSTPMLPATATSSATLESAQRAFLRRWRQGGPLDRAEPDLTRYRE